MKAEAPNSNTPEKIYYNKNFRVACAPSNVVSRRTSKTRWRRRERTLIPMATSYRLSTARPACSCTIRSGF